jgi:hypothetical protein
MPFDSAGNFTRDYNWQSDRDASIKIEAVRMDGEFDNFATGMNQLMLRSGVTPITGNLNLNGNVITNVGRGTLTVPSVSFTGDPTTGIYSPAAGEVSIVSDGVSQINVTAAGTTCVTPLNIIGPAGTVRPLNFMTGATYAATGMRWQIIANLNAESGSNVGSGFNILRYDDNGNLLDSPIVITRNGGVVTIGAGGLDVTGIATFNANPCINGAAGTNRGFSIQTSGVNRWSILTTAVAENPPNNVGTDLLVQRLGDNGVAIDNPITIYRNTGLVTLSSPGGLTVNGPATFNGSIQVTDGAFYASGSAGTSRGLVIQTSSQARWQILGESTTESGSNAGTNFTIARYSDTGAYIDQPLTINRATGLVATNSPAGFTVANGILNVRGSSQINIDGAAGAGKLIYFMTNSVPRWVLYSDPSGESGSNAGSNLQLTCYTDGGAGLFNVMTVTRATGEVALGGNLNVAGIISLNSSTLSVKGAAATVRATYYSTGNSNRWYEGADNSAESGGNVGSNYFIAYCTDAGAYAGTALSIARNTGIVTCNVGLTVPTVAKGDNSSNVATTGFVFARGIQSAPQIIYSTPATINLQVSDAGHNIILGAGVTQVNFAGSGAAAALTYMVNNQTAVDVALSFPNGTDYRAVLHTGEQIVVQGDGGGFYRLISTGNGGTATYGFAGVNGWERTPSGRIEQWGTTGSIASNSSAAITFPKGFTSTPWNITFNPVGSAGSGGMAYSYPLGVTANGFSIFNAGAAAVAFYWRATGV